ncbi:hypothetical protein Tco_0448142 [Tanacetum coccineum]
MKNQICCLSKIYAVFIDINTLYQSTETDMKHRYAVSSLMDTAYWMSEQTHDDQDPPNDCKGETRKKIRKDAGKPSSRSSKKDKVPMVHVQENAHAQQPQDRDYVQEHSNAGWFIKKLGSTNVAKRRTTWFNLLLKYDIDQNEDHIIGPSIVVMAKKLKELIQKDELTIADLEVLTEAQWNNGIEDLIPDRWSKKFHRYQIKSLNGIHHWEDRRHDFFKAEINNMSPDKVYSNKRIISVIRIDVKKKWGYGFLTSIVVRRLVKKEYEFNYVDLPRLSLNDVKDMYLLKMKLDEVNKFYDDTLLKIHDNLLKMVNKNELSRGNKWLKGRNWNDKYIKRPNLKSMLEDDPRHLTYAFL